MAMMARHKPVKPIRTKIQRYAIEPIGSEFSNEDKLLKIYNAQQIPRWIWPEPFMASVIFLFNGGMHYATK